MRKTDILLLMLVAMTAMGCQQIDDATVVSGKPVDVSLSFAVSNANKQNITRQSDLVVQEGSARSLQILNIIPFATKGKVKSTDMPKFGIFGGEQKTYNRTNSCYFYYGLCSFISGVSSFLVYGKAEPVTGDAVNGALDVTFPADQSPAGITFSPKQIRSTEAVHAGASAIATYLTTIAHTEGWSSTTDAHLQTYYQNFIGQGSESTSLIAGSSRNVGIYVTRLKTLLEAEPESDLRDAIITNIDKTYPADYPSSIGLPDGAAALRWEIPTGGSEYAFVPQTVTTTEAAINSLTRFAYPAELYYYGNSRICTSTIDNRESYYNKTSWGTSNTDENTVLEGFEYDPGTVSPNTKAIAIKDPVQYAVARLDAKIKAATSSLTDANDKAIAVGSTSFPLTGIIIGGQRPVGFDFTPIDDSDVNMRLIYDSNVNTNTGNTPFYLSSTEQGPVRTLVLQSYDGEDVTFVLEFQNDSGQDFAGVDGIVYNGTKFYLVGNLQLSDATGTDKTRVFTQDHTTTATLTVNGLSKAYNVMPNLLSPQLEIGITLTTSWTGSTPTSTILE